MIQESTKKTRTELMKTMYTIENRTSVLIDKTRKGTLINYWIDVTNDK